MPDKTTRAERRKHNLCEGCGKEPLPAKGSYGPECRRYLKDYGKLYRAEHGVTGTKNKCTLCRKVGHTRGKCPDFPQVQQTRKGG